MNAMRQFIAVRAALGAVAWLAPRFAGRLTQLDPDANPQAPYLARLYAVREIALAVVIMQSEGEARRNWVRLGLAVDAIDALSALLALRGGYLSPRATVGLVGLPAYATAVGLKALSADAEVTPSARTPGGAG